MATDDRDAYVAELRDSGLTDDQIAWVLEVIDRPPLEPSQEAVDLWDQISQKLRDDLDEGETPEQRFTAWAGSDPSASSERELRYFLRHLEEGPSDPPLVVEQDDGDDWASVRGGPLDQPILVRLAQLRGRPRVVGLSIDNGTEITAATLRRIRLGEILSLIGGDPHGPNLSGVAPDEVDVVRMDWADARQTIESLPELVDENAAPVRGTAPDGEKLKTFARVLREERRRAPHGAMSRTSRRMTMARSTAYRWARLAVEADHLREDELP